MADKTNLKKLEPGKTKIGQIPGKDDNGNVCFFEVFYGNFLTPPVNGKYKSLKEPKYRELLANFLQSEEGLNYETPTEAEIEHAKIAVLNARNQVKNRIEEMKKKEEEERLRKEVESIDKLPSDMFDDEDENEETDDDDTYSNKPIRHESGSNPPMFIFILIIVLLVANLAAGAFNAWNTYSSTQNAQNKRINLTIGEKTYEVPSSEIPEAGDSTVVLYGIITTNVNGEVKRTAVPLGEVKVEGVTGNE